MPALIELDASIKIKLNARLNGRRGGSTPESLEHQHAILVVRKVKFLSQEDPARSGMTTTASYIAR